MPSLCTYRSCRKCATFNLPGNKNRLRCLDHKTCLMVSVNKGNRPCQHPFCIREASYNFPGLSTKRPTPSRIFCKTHASEGMVDVGIKRCSTPGCEISVHSSANKQYNGKCMTCFVDSNPTVKIFRNVKVREREMTKFIKDTCMWPNAVFDKSIIGGISMYRPDVYIDTMSHAVIVECDENQHMKIRKKNKSDIEDRIRNTSLQIDAKKPIVIIRFNPDRYETANNVVKSCFFTNDDGKVCIRDETAWKSRLQRLREEIEIQLIPKNKMKIITVVRLFYSS